MQRIERTTTAPRPSAARTARGEAIVAFAAVLRDCREMAGNPSFRAMAARSRVISHTTLHEAAQGHRLPSWGTTVEFVHACGADPMDVRARWEGAERAIAVHRARQDAGQRSGGIEEVAASRTGWMPAGAPPPLVQSDPADPDRPPEPAFGDTTRRRRRLHPLLIAGCTGAAVGMIAGGGFVAGVGMSGGGGSASRSAESTTSAETVGSAGSAGSADRADLSSFRAKDCPVSLPDPPAAASTHAGDAAELVADVTLPDCAAVGPGTVATKVWRLQNTGIVPWVGRTLQRVDDPVGPDGCQTIAHIPIGETPPGATVDVAVDVVIPSEATFCVARFKMFDDQGQEAFPGKRPVNFQLVVP